MDKTMSIIGGLNMYSWPLARYGSDTPPLGRHVRFLNRNGRDSEVERANKYFKEDQILTVKEIYVGRSSSDVEFVMYPGLKFNTVLFADVTEEEVWSS